VKPTSAICFTDRKIVRGLYDYEPRQGDDLRFKKGDKMEVLNIPENR